MGVRAPSIDNSTVYRYSLQPLFGEESCEKGYKKSPILGVLMMMISAESESADM